jgi:hypothetical protein
MHFPALKINAAGQPVVFPQNSTGILKYNRIYPFDECVFLKEMHQAYIRKIFFYGEG